MRIDRYGRTISSHLAYMSVQEKAILKAAAKSCKQSLSGFLVSKALGSAEAREIARALRYAPKMEE